MEDYSRKDNYLQIRIGTKKKDAYIAKLKAKGIKGGQTAHITKYIDKFLKDK